MQDAPYYPLGHVGSAEVGVQPTLDGQDILIQHGDIGQRLACLLAMGQTDIVGREGAYFWRIAHDRQVDGLLVELIDLLISIRYAHPTLVQLELALPFPSSVEGGDSEGMIPEPAEP
jgi:hypothetical protein